MVGKVCQTSYLFRGNVGFHLDAVSAEERPDLLVIVHYLEVVGVGASALPHVAVDDLRQQVRNRPVGLLPPRPVLLDPSRRRVCRADLLELFGQVVGDVPEVAR